LGLVNPSYHELFADSDAEDAQWFSVNQLPKLAFDHQSIIDIALKRLRTKIQYQPIGFNLLNEEFAFSDLENLYKTIIGKEIDRRNFRKKIMSYGLLNETNNLKKKAAEDPENSLLLIRKNTRNWKSRDFISKSNSFFKHK
jgi:8-oxo-dGTP diphosphatase